MQKDLQVLFRGIDHSHALEQLVRKRVEKLERFVGNIITCRVVLDSPHKHHHKGKVYHVSVEVKVPGGEVVVNRDRHKKQEHEDMYLVIRDVFNTVERQLRALNKPKRERVKISAKLDEVEKEELTDAA